MSPDRRRLFSWENHAQQHPPQEAEARGIRRALGWGATILSGAGVLLGWFLSKFGTVILYSLGLGGSGGGK